MSGLYSNIFKKIVYGFILLAVVGALWFAFASDKRAATLEYSDPRTGISLQYPDRLSISERKTDEPATIIRFTGKDTSTAMAAFVVANDRVEKEKLFYEGILFKDPEAQAVNSRVRLDDYSGYRSQSTYDLAIYSLYRQLNASSSLIVRSEIAASSSPALAGAVSDFMAIISSISVE